MSFLHAALRFRVWVGRSSKSVDASMRLEEDVRLVWNGMNRENALDYKASMFLYIPLDTSGIGFCGKAYKSCINGNVYVYNKEPPVYKRRTV